MFLMRRRIAVILTVLVIAVLAVPLSAAATAAEESDSGEDAGDIIDQVRQQLEAVFENIDQDSASDIFSFIKEKIAEGDLTTEEGLQSAIEEGNEKFGVTISKEDAQKLVSAMEKLESMGFSAEDLVEKTENLYQKYGADFVDHVDEIVSGAIKNAVSNAISSFFENLVNSVKGFFNDLFS